MKKLQFTKEIKAPAQKVWDTLWNEATYSQWTTHFNPNPDGSTIKSDWKVGGKTLFLDTKGNGMVSTIKTKNEPYEVVFEHLGEVKDGKEDTTSEKVKSWAGSLEEYQLSESNGITTVKAAVQAGEEWEEMLNNGFTKGLEIVKKLSEVEKPVAKSLAIVIPAYRMHSQMFNNMLDGVQEADAQTRIENKTIHFAWMVGNLVNCRYWLAGILGIPEKDPNEELFKDAKALDINAKYPSLEELKKEWHKISPLLYQKLLSVEEAELMQKYEFGMNIPFVEENKLNMVGMCIDRESYLFGQLGLMRKVLGCGAVKYETNDNLNY